MERPPVAAATPTPTRSRAGRAIRARHNWVQLAKFSTVGASGYIVNLAVFATLLDWAGLQYRLAAVVSFVVAVSNNYTWNRFWTFHGQRGHFAYQGLRFFGVSLFALAANVLILTALVGVGLGEIVSQAIAIILVTPLNFIGNKLWSFRHR